MVLKNISSGIILSKNVKQAKSLMDLSLGLLKSSNPRSLLFRTRLGIHTFGLKDSIDVLVLNNRLQVVKQATLKPNSLFFWNIKHDLVIELPKDSLKLSKTQIGHQIEIR